MLTNEELTQKYKQTYGEDIVFDDVKQKGKFIVAAKKEEKNRFLVGGAGVENERNSMIYYVIDTASGQDMKMVITSQEEVANSDTNKRQKTTLEIFSGKNIIANLSAFDVYLDTADNAQIGAFLAGAYPEARYSSYSPQTEQLFKAWHNSVKDTYPVQSEKFDKYHKAEIEEIRKILKISRQFFANFVGSKTELKIAREYSSIMDRISSFYKRLIARRQNSDIKTFYNHYMDNNRF